MEQLGARLELGKDFGAGASHGLERVGENEPRGQVLGLREAEAELAFENFAFPVERGLGGIDAGGAHGEELLQPKEVIGRRRMRGESRILRRCESDVGVSGQELVEEAGEFGKSLAGIGEGAGGAGGGEAGGVYGANEAQLDGPRLRGDG